MESILSLNPSRLNGRALSRSPSPASSLSGSFVSTLWGLSSTLLSRSLLANSQSKHLWQSGALNHEVSVGNRRWRSDFRFWGGMFLQRMMAIATGRTRPCRARLKADWVYGMAAYRSRLRPQPRSDSSLFYFGYPRSATELLRLRGFKKQQAIDRAMFGSVMVFRCFVVLFLQIRQGWVRRLTVYGGGVVRRRSWLRFPQSWVPRSLIRAKFGVPKKKRGRPFGSKNKKPSGTQARANTSSVEDIFGSFTRSPSPSDKGKEKQ